MLVPKSPTTKIVGFSRKLQKARWRRYFTLRVLSVQPTPAIAPIAAEAKSMPMSYPAFIFPGRSLYSLCDILAANRPASMLSVVTLEHFDSPIQTRQRPHADIKDPRHRCDQRYDLPRIVTLPTRSRDR